MPAHPPATLEARKTIFEFRIPANLQFNAKLNQAAENFLKLDPYQHWETDRLSFTFFDYIRHCTAYFSLKKFGFELDHRNDFDFEAERIRTLIDFSIKEFQLSSFGRIGLRRKYLVPVKMNFAQLTILLQEKLFTKNEAAFAAIPRDVDDVMHVWNFRRKPFTFHIQLGPVTKAEAEQHVAFNQKRNVDMRTHEGREFYKKIAEGYPDQSLFIDIDCYFGNDKESHPIDQLLTHFDGIGSQNRITAENITKYIFAAEPLDA